MFLYARSAAYVHRPASASVSLSPIFREQYLGALAKGQPRILAANSLRLKAAEKEETLICGLKDYSTATDTTSEISSSNDVSAIEASSDTLEEAFTLPADVGFPTIASNTEACASAAKHLTYSPSNRTYAALKELERDVEGGKEPVNPQPAQSAPHTVEFKSPAVSSVEVVGAELGIPFDIPTEKPSLPLDKDDEFTIIDHDVDTRSTPAVLIQGANVEPDDVDTFVLIPREAEDTLSEQPNVMDGGDDWLEVEA